MTVNDVAFVFPGCVTKFSIASVTQSLSMQSMQMLVVDLRLENEEHDKDF
jgi:hypothetical protein